MTDEENKDTNAANLKRKVSPVICTDTHRHTQTHTETRYKTRTDIIPSYSLPTSFPASSKQTAFCSIIPQTPYLSLKPLSAP